MDYIVIKALEDGVSVLSVISNDNTPALNERLNEGEVFVLPLHAGYMGVRIRGKAEVDTVHGKCFCESRILFT